MRTIVRIVRIVRKGVVELAMGAVEYVISPFALAAAWVAMFTAMLYAMGMLVTGFFGGDILDWELVLATGVAACILVCLAIVVFTMLKGAYEWLAYQWEKSEGPL